MKPSPAPAVKSEPSKIVRSLQQAARSIQSLLAGRRKSTSSNVEPAAAETLVDQTGPNGSSDDGASTPTSAQLQTQTDAVAHNDTDDFPRQPPPQPPRKFITRASPPSPPTSPPPPPPQQLSRSCLARDLPPPLPPRRGRGYPAHHVFVPISFLRPSAAMSKQPNLPRTPHHHCELGGSSDDCLLRVQSTPTAAAASSAEDLLLQPQRSESPLAHEWQFLDNELNWQTYVYEQTVLLERMFLQDRNSCAYFERGGYRYTVNFATMQQTNQSTGRWRPVRRIGNPNCASTASDSASGAAVAKADQFTKMVAAFVPKTWQSQANEAYSGYWLLDVSNSGETWNEYKEIAALFRKTAPQHKRLKSIKRVENHELFIAFHVHKTQIEARRRKQVEVRRLFHGTRGEYIHAICRQGFDCRLHGSATGFVFGRGSYFARDARYSLDYSDCGKMLVVQVRCAVGSGEIRW
jgi:hypothetical protein